MIDLHVHTETCRHAHGDAAAYVRAAEQRGVDIMAFTDHLPLLDTDETEYAMGRSEVPGYVEEVAGLQATAALEVLLGIEADWVADREDETAAMLAGHGFDIVLGSVHFIADWAFDDPRLIDRYEEWDVGALWDRYFADLERAVRSGLFDVAAHPDLVKKFGIRPSVEPIARYEAVASALADTGMAVEISTGGLRKPVAEIYPSETFLRTCRDAGVPITIGSDAHHPDEVAYAYADAVALARRVGYTSAVTFRGRVAQEVPL